MPPEERAQLGVARVAAKCSRSFSLIPAFLSLAFQPMSAGIHAMRRGREEGEGSAYFFEFEVTLVDSSVDLCKRFFLPQEALPRDGRAGGLQISYDALVHCPSLCPQ